MPTWYLRKDNTAPEPTLVGGAGGIETPLVTHAPSTTLLEGGLAVGEDLTIAAGSITPTALRHHVAPQSGTLDYLAGIVGGYEGRLLVIDAVAGKFIFIRHNDTVEGTDGNRIFLPTSANWLLLPTLPLALMWDGTLDSGNGGWLPLDSPGLWAAMELGKVMVTSSDSTPDYLASKLVAGSGVEITQVGETLSVAAPMEIYISLGSESMTIP